MKFTRPDPSGSICLGFLVDPETGEPAECRPCNLVQDTIDRADAHPQIGWQAWGTFTPPWGGCRWVNPTFLEDFYRFLGEEWEGE